MFNLAKRLRGVLARRRTEAAPLPARGKELLSRTYRHYQRLPFELKASFSQAAQAFLEDRRITGVEIDVRPMRRGCWLPPQRSP